MTPHTPVPRTNLRRVLVTGAAGRIGRAFSEASVDRYRLRLLDRPDSGIRKMANLGEVVTSELTHLSEITPHFQEIDTVIHLAANPSPSADWESLLPDNIVATHHVITAAMQADCRRVVLASSIHAVSGYPIERQVHPDDPVNPGDLYGVTKCFSEALGRYAAEQRGLSCIVIRIGAFQPVEEGRDEKKLPLLNSFASNRDIVQLFQRAVDDERLRFAIVHGLSGNIFNRMDTTSARELLGYEPQDDLSELNPAVKPLNLRDNISAHSEKNR